MTEKCMNFRLKQTLEVLIGAEVFGPMIIFGIGVRAREVDGHRFGFNIGYGFGDTSAASENVIFMTVRLIR